MAILVIMLVGGTGLRLWNIDSSRDTFHPTRQYAGLALAKDWYLDLGGDVPATERPAVRANGDSSPRLELKLLEAVVALGYRLLGGPREWLGGALSALLWGAGAVFLHLLARRVASMAAGLVAVALYLFQPYAVQASRSFQPDPAMVVAFLAATLAGARWAERPTLRRLLAASVLSGAAILVKPMSAFLVGGALLSIALGSGQARRLLRPAALACLALGILPAIGYYGLQVLGETRLSSWADSGLLPSLWREDFYWRGWRDMIERTVGVGPALISLVGIAVARTKLARSLLAGLFTAYIAYGLVFSYHIHTHDYYHLQLIPMVALGLGVMTDAALAVVRRREVGKVARGVAALATTALFVVVAVVDLGVVGHRPRPVTDRQLAAADAIGDAVDHSTRVVTLAFDYGRPLGYHASLAGPAWPTRYDNWFLILQGRRPTGLDEQLDVLVSGGAEWFVITDLAELRYQRGLLPLLERRARLVSANDAYLLFDLRPARARAGGEPVPRR